MNAPFRFSAEGGLRASGIPRLNQAHPLVGGLTNCYVPGAGGGDRLIDLGTMGVDLTRTGSAANAEFSVDAYDGGVPCIISSGTTDSYFSGAVGALAAMTDALSVRILWRCQQATGATKGIFSYGNTQTDGQPDLLIQAHNGALRLYVNSGYRFTLSGELINGSLYDIVATYSDAENLWRLYINGVERGTYGNTQSARDRTNLYLGHGYNSAAAGNYLACMVWDRCLTPGEVWSLYDPATGRDIWKWQDLPFETPKQGNLVHLLSPDAMGCGTWSETPNILQVHLVSPADMPAAVGLAEAELSHGISVAPLSLEIAPDVEQPGLTQIHEMGAADVLASAVSDSPLLVQFHALPAGALDISAILETTTLALVSEGAPVFRTIRLPNDGRGIGIPPTNRTSSISE